MNHDPDLDLDDIPTRIAQAAAVARATYTPYEEASACSLLRDLLAAAKQHGVTFAHFDGSIDLPRTCLEVIRQHGEDDA